MSSAEPLSEFANYLEAKRIGIVYSDRFSGELAETWYHRWKTNVIAFFSQAVQGVKARPVFFNVDQFISFCSAYDNPNLAFVVNLNAGNRFLDNWAVVPALCQWRGIPVFPSTAMTVMLGENKVLSKIVAHQLGWRIPRSIHDTPEVIDRFIMKPATFGSSVGMQEIDRRVAGSISVADTVIEEFIPGFDLTLVLLYSSVERDLVCMGAQATVPIIAHPETWTLNAFGKRHPGVRTPVEELLCPVEDELASKSVSLGKLYGSRALTRIDARVSRKPEKKVPIHFGDCTFLEINPMPTVGPTNSVTKFAQEFISANGGHPSLDWLERVQGSAVDLAACYILVGGLYAISSQ